MKERIQVHSIAEVASAMCTPVYRALTADRSSRFARAELAMSWTTVDIDLLTMERCRIVFEFPTGTRIEAEFELVEQKYRLIAFQMRWDEGTEKYEIELNALDIEDLERLGHTGRVREPSLLLKAHVARIERRIQWVKH